MARSIKLEYVEYKSLEEKLVPGTYPEVKEETSDGLAYRKTIILFLGEREFRFVGPWKHEYHGPFDEDKNPAASAEEVA